MCKQFIAIAQCAPLNPENCALTFQCGQLHHYAANRENCDEAKGECICFFGTCGRIDNVVRSQPFDLRELPKMRCLRCTGREEQVGERQHGRDFLETKLLTREAVDEKGMPAYAKILKECWEGATECPYHDVTEDEPPQATPLQKDADEKPVDDNDGANQHVDAQVEPEPANPKPAIQEPPSTVKNADGQAVANESTCENTNDDVTAETDTHEVAGNAAATHIKQEPASSHGTPNKLDHIPAFTGEAPQSADKSNEDSPQIKPMLGIETSRWAPADGARLDAAFEPEKGPRLDSATPRSTPRRELYNTPNVQPGKSAISHKASDIKKFLGL